MKRDKTIFKYDELINLVMEQSIAFTKSRVLLTAFELDIFTILGDSAMSGHEVSQKINASKNGVERLMNALVSLELLEKIGDKFRNTKAAYTLLVKGNPNYMSNLNHINYIWKRWEGLTEAVINGTATSPERVCDRTDEQIDNFIANQNWRSTIQAQEILKLCNMGNIDRVLDLGCGSGVIGLEMLKMNPGMNLTLFEYPRVVERTKDYVEKKGLSDDVNILSGDMIVDDFGKGYDVVILSNVLHSYSMMDCLKIMRNVFDSMNKGGRVLIHEYLLEEGRDKPEYAALSSLNMLVHTAGGDYFTETDVWLFLKESMFSDIKKEETSFGSHVIMARK